MTSRSNLVAVGSTGVVNLMGGLSTYVLSDDDVLPPSIDGLRTPRLDSVAVRLTLIGIAPLSLEKATFGDEFVEGGEKGNAGPALFRLTPTGTSPRYSNVIRTRFIDRLCVAFCRHA